MMPVIKADNTVKNAIMLLTRELCDIGSRMTTPSGQSVKKRLRKIECEQ